MQGCSYDFTLLIFHLSECWMILDMKWIIQNLEWTMLWRKWLKSYICQQVNSQKAMFVSLRSNHFRIEDKNVLILRESSCLLICFKCCSKKSLCLECLSCEFKLYKRLQLFPWAINIYPYCLVLVGSRKRIWLWFTQTEWLN